VPSLALNLFRPIQNSRRSPVVVTLLLFSRTSRSCPCYNTNTVRVETQSRREAFLSAVVGVSAALVSARSSDVKKFGELSASVFRPRLRHHAVSHAVAPASHGWVSRNHSLVALCGGDRSSCNSVADVQNYVRSFLPRTNCQGRLSILFEHSPEWRANSFTHRFFPARIAPFGAKYH